MTDKEYDVALSFAGEDRYYAEEVAKLLKAGGYSVFYDQFERARLWGKNLYTYFSSIYKDQAHYCVIFLSEHYAQKLWANHELQSAQARAFEESQEYILPVRLDDTEIPGVLPTVGYLDLRSMTIEQVYQVLVEKLSGATSQIPIINANTSEERINQNARAEFSEGLAYQNSVTETSSREEKKEKHEKAIMHYSRALELKPDYVDAYNARGVVYSMMGQINYALKDFGMVVQLAPDYFLVYLNRGAIHKNDGRYEQALKDFGTAIKLNPNLNIAYFNRGEVYRIKGDFDRAIADYNRAIQLKPDYAETYNDRGIAYANKGEVGRAIVDYTEVIELKPSLAGVYYNRGVAWLRLGEWEKARVDLTDARVMGVNIIAAFRNDYASVTDFEQKHEVKLPGHLAEMLTSQQ